MEKSYQPLQTITVTASADLATVKRFVKMSSGKLAYAGANEQAIGTLALEVSSGEQASVITAGVVVVEVGSGGVTENTFVTSDANGKAVAVPNVSISIPAGATPMTASSATPTLTLAGGTLPTKINGIALDTVSAGGFARILLK